MTHHRIKPTTHTTKMVPALVALSCLALVVLRGNTVVDGFQTTTIARTRLSTTRTTTTTTPGTAAGFPRTTATTLDPLYLFGRNKEESNERGEGETDTETTTATTTTTTTTTKRKIPFFGRFQRSGESDAAQTESDEATATATATIAEKREESKPSSSSSSLSSSPPTRKQRGTPAPVTPADLRLMAEKARLEAEKLDAELTLAKIEKLEKQLVRAKKDQAATAAAATATATATTSTEGSTASAGNVNANANAKTVVVQDLQYELDVLQAKVRGEAPPVKAKTTTTSSSSASSSSSSSSVPSKSASIAVPTATIEVTRDAGPIVEIDNAKVLEAATIVSSGDTGAMNQVQTADDLEFVPNFLLRILASFVGMKSAPGIEVDKTEFLRRWNMTRDLDYSFFEDKEPPVFTSSDIRRKKVQILEWGAGNKTAEEMLMQMNNNDNSNSNVDELPLVVTPVMIERANGNATQLAIYSLEHDYYMRAGTDVLNSQPIEELLPEIVKETITGTNYFGEMYPKCVNKRGENNNDDDYVSEEPTAAMMEVLTQTILPAVKFSTSAKPYKVPGGYAITGTHKYETGDALIEAIDSAIQTQRPNLKDQLTVLYTPRYGPLENISLAGETMDSLSSMNNFLDSTEVFADQEPILFVAGPNLVRDANPLGLVLASIIGLATSWYLSIYPFLLNDKIAARIDSDLQLVEANLQPDLSYLTQLSVPLFYCFMGLQLVHEIAHSLTAASKNVKLSVPVFVPSFITGITSTVTTFKTLPKNKNEMFDIAAAGPLAGVVASSLVLLVGAKLTLVSDPATLPALPLEILRQSTLGGAIIDNVIPGSLYVPDGAPTAGIFVPLHPFAVAGYVSLIINALALLPVGTTDGGRLTMALFDRAEKMSIGTLTLFALLWSGLFGSDLFLFYFSFCIAFQSGNEVPARNEQDSVDFSRVIVAIVCYGLAILTLIPVQ